MDSVRQVRHVAQHNMYYERGVDLPFDCIGTMSEEASDF
jgi:hypothetical protein